MSERPLVIEPHPGCQECRYHRLFLPLFPGPVEVWSRLVCSPTRVVYSWHCEACMWSGMQTQSSQAACDAADAHRCGFPAAPPDPAALW